MGVSGKSEFFSCKIPRLFRIHLTRILKWVNTELGFKQIEEKQAILCITLLL